MSYEINLESGEEIVIDIDFKTSKKATSFRFAVSTRSLFILRKKIIRVSDPIYFEKVPLSKIKTVFRKRLKPYVWWMLSVLMIIAGALLTVVMIQPIIEGEGGKFSVYPPAAVVVGIVMPFAAHKRYGIKIEMINGNFIWKPEIVIDKASKNKITEVQNQILAACKQVGIHTVDEKSSV